MANQKKTRHSNGSGSFRKRKDGTIEYRVSYGYDLSGKLIRKSFYGKTQSECREEKKRYEKKMPVPVDKVYIVSEWARKWLELYKKDKCSVNMYEQYEHIVDNYIIPNIGHLKISSVKPAHIVEMMNKYKDKSESLVGKIILSTRSIFETAIDNDFCVKNPAKNVKPEGKKRKEREFFNEKEIEIIEKFCFEERSNISDAFIILLYTGLRREELLGLMWEDVDFENDAIHINRAVVMESATKKIKDTLKSDSSRRVIPMLPKARLILRTKPKTSDYVFPTRTGEAQNPVSFSATYRTLLKRINKNNEAENQIKELSAHCCRHTFATHLSKQGVDIKTIQGILGHANISVTGNIYTHSTIGGLKKALNGFKY